MEFLQLLDFFGSQLVFHKYVAHHKGLLSSFKNCLESAFYRLLHACPLAGCLVGLPLAGFAGWLPGWAASGWGLSSPLPLRKPLCRQLAFVLILRYLSHVIGPALALGPL